MTAGAASTTGGCLCGGIRFELTEPARPDSAGYCHCTRCQRRTGTAASASGRIAPGSLKVVSGEELVRAYEPGDGGFAKMVVLSLHEFQFFSKLTIFFSYPPQCDIPIPDLRHPTIKRREDFERNAEDLPERPAKKLQYPLALTRE